MDLAQIVFAFNIICLCHSIPFQEERRGYCDFPDYLHKETPESDVTGLKWYTRAEFSGNTEVLTKEREILIHRTEMVVRIVLHELCRDPFQNSTFPCNKKRVKQNLMCVSREADGKYRVQVEENGKSIFTCMKFIPRGRNIVQVWSGRENPLNNDYLCSDDLMRRNPWPWIAETQREWSFCPLVGGYSFRGTLDGEKEICSKEWKPSRLESECIHGEGIQFIFPKPRCSLYAGDKREVLTVNCWGHWVEENYFFVLMAIPGKRPQLVLRLPRYYQEEQTVSGLIYYSPVTPLRGGQTPPATGISYLSFTLFRNEGGVCFDESEHCEQFARDGKCTASEINKKASSCKKSCGLCGGVSDLTLSASPECSFPEEYLGSWSMYEDTFVENILITEGRVSFQKSGAFVCKGKHWNKNYYKMLSVFENGCYPRFTCFNFRRNSRTLLFQMSRSSLGDESFDMCKFEDDPAPLGDAFRSENFKLLLPRSSMTQKSCGLSVSQDVEVMFTDTHTCKGSISDWNAKTCQPESKLTMHLSGCSKFNWREFFCVSHTHLGDGVSVLITYDIIDNSKKYRCWMVKPFVEGMSMRPWSSAVMYSSAQCGSLKHTAMVGTGPSVLSLTSQVQLANPASKYHIEQPCHLHKYTTRNTFSTSTAATVPERRIDEVDNFDIYMNDHHSKSPKYGVPIEETTYPNRRPHKDGQESVIIERNITGAHLKSNGESTRQSYLSAVILTLFSWIIIVLL